MMLSSLFATTPPPGPIHLHEERAFTLDGVISPAEAAAVIAYAETVGFDAAPITTGPDRFEMRPEVRNNTRVMVDDHAAAACLFERVRHALPDATSLNERFRIYRYEPGQRFRWHGDGSYRRPDGSERSFYTLMVYLNEDFEGGHTEFGDFSIEPRTGRALLFHHPMTHQGATVLRGTKYVLRTDVMF